MCVDPVRKMHSMAEQRDLQVTENDEFVSSQYPPSFGTAIYSHDFSFSSSAQDMLDVVE
jgi:hypothetical protein